MKRPIIFFTLLAFLAACQNAEKSTEVETTETGHEEAESNVVSLTPEQLKTGGILTGSIEMKNLRSSIRANGTLTVPNQNKALITSLSSGVLRSLNIQPGSYVRKGQVVATIINPEAAQSQQELQEVNTEINLAEKELARQKVLVAGDAAPLKNVQRAQAELTSLRSKRNSLQKQLIAVGISPGSVSRGRISTTINITAPISGTISNVTAQIGSSIDQSTPVAEIVNNSQLHLDLFVYEKDLPNLHKNQTIHFTLTNNPGKEYDAKIYSIGTAFANESKTIPIHSIVLGNHSELIEGMSITALISIGQRMTTAVPTDAIVSDKGKDFIFVQTTAPKESHEESKSSHEEGEEHAKAEDHEEEHGKEEGLYFEKVQVVKGVSDVGYTEITVMKSIPPNSVVITKGAFFVLAKMSGGGGHAH
ncbi:MAG TPA: efflux RND transporter periplasmic adaptor subunit [Sphingobacteriaceae bacterium]|nr:efflux RND transporter periplasmic adaptor subunit [Sphingobacteriaceae bacterium]